MKIAILGPSDLEGWKNEINISNDLLLLKTNEIADSLVSLNHEILIVPQVKSMSELFASKYKDIGGKKVTGIIPMDDTEFGIENLDETDCDEIINCVTWRNQPEKLCESSDLLLVLGLSPGVLTEIGGAKYFGKPKVVIINDFITSKLPYESLLKIDAKYCNFDELDEHILENDK